MAAKSEKRETLRGFIHSDLHAVRAGLNGKGCGFCTRSFRPVLWKTKEEPAKARPLPAVFCKMRSRSAGGPARAAARRTRRGGRRLAAAQSGARPAAHVPATERGAAPARYGKSVLRSPRRSRRSSNRPRIPPLTSMHTSPISPARPGTNSWCSSSETA